MSQRQAAECVDTRARSVRGSLRRRRGRRCARRQRRSRGRPRHPHQNERNVSIPLNHTRDPGAGERIFARGGVRVRARVARRRDAPRRSGGPVARCALVEGEGSQHAAAPVSFPPTLGFDLSGVVDAVGADVDDPPELGVGAEVIGNTGLADASA